MRIKLLAATLVPLASSVVSFMVALLQELEVIEARSSFPDTWCIALTLAALALQIIMVYQAHHAIRERYLAKRYPEETDATVLKRRWRLDDGGAVGVSLWADTFAPCAVVSSLESLLFWDRGLIYLLLLIVFVIIMRLTSLGSLESLFLSGSSVGA